MAMNAPVSHVPFCNVRRTMAMEFNGAAAWKKFAYDKKLIVKELTKHGIQSILSTPQNLTINTINRYLELKAKQKI